MKTLTYRHPVEITYDDGTGEPDGKCPCESGIYLPPVYGCCTGNKERPDGFPCCKCHGGDLPCLSDWHKKAEPETRDKVIAGFVRKYHGGDPLDTLVFSPNKQPDYQSATLTIHEPVKEQTLVEAVEAFLHGWNNGPTYEAGKRMGDLRAALAREKAKVSRP